MRFAMAIVVLAGACGRVGFMTRDTRDDGGSLGDGPAVGDAPMVADDAAAIPPGAKIWLAMETAPPLLVDSAGGHELACVGACPSRVAGVHGSGFQFSGQVLDITSRADLDASAGFTAATWVKLDALPMGGDNPACFWTMSFVATSGFDTFTLCIDDTGTTKFDGETPTGTAETETGPTVLPNAWHHVAIAWDGLRRRSYLDGIQVANTAMQLGHGAENPEVGAARGGFHLFGVLDDTVYYTRALSAAEVAMLATP